MTKQKKIKPLRDTDDRIPLGEWGGHMWYAKGTTIYWEPKDNNNKDLPEHSVE